MRNAPCCLWGELFRNPVCRAIVNQKISMYVQKCVVDPFLVGNLDFETSSQKASLSQPRLRVRGTVRTHIYMVRTLLPLREYHIPVGTYLQWCGQCCGFLSVLPIHWYSSTYVHSIRVVYGTAHTISARQTYRTTVPVVRVVVSAGIYTRT